MTRDLGRQLREAWIVEAVRTPIGRRDGALRSVRPDDLAALVIRAAVERSGIDPALIDDVVLGDANGAGEDNRNVARMAVLLAGLPVEVAGQTINRLCGSGLQAVNTAAHAIMAADGEVMLAGGVESMSRAPFVELKPEPGREVPPGSAPEPADTSPPERADSTLGWRFVNPRMQEAYPVVPLGETAEIVAEQWQVSREEQDAFALRSQQRAAAAMRDGRFDAQLVPVEVRAPDGSTMLVERDEHPRPATTAEALAGLAPVFREGGTVTAGNASGINDGAAALVVVEASRARALGLPPLARIVSTAVAGVDPSVMGIGPGAGHAQGARACRSGGGRSRPHRAQRGLRQPVDRLHARAGARSGSRERQRWRHRAGASAGHERRPSDGDAGTRAAPTGCALRAGYDVHRGRAGHRHHRGEPAGLTRRSHTTAAGAARGQGYQRRP